MKQKNPHAVALGKLGGKASLESRSAEDREEFHRAGGKAGGVARAAKLNAQQRKEIAKKAAAVRWRKKPKKAGVK